MSVHSPITESSFRTSRRRWLAGALCLPLAAGCTQMAVVGRIFYGDPKQEGAFKKVTGKSLKKGRVALICTAPQSIRAEYDMVSIDIQQELTRLMKKKKINMVDADAVSRAIDDNGGVLELQAIVSAVDADFLFHVDIEHFSHIAPHSPNLFHGRAVGYVYGYEIRKPNDESAVVHAVQIFEREFDTEYPGKHPVPADRTPERVFRNRFINHVSKELGRIFYDYRTNETF